MVYGASYAHICLDFDCCGNMKKAIPKLVGKSRCSRKQSRTTSHSFHHPLHDTVGERSEPMTRFVIRLPPEKKRQTLSKARDRFRNYPFSVVKVFNLELEDAVEVFQRINQGGKRLTRFELVAANCWSESFDLAKAVKGFNERVEQRTDFGRWSRSRSSNRCLS